MVCQLLLILPDGSLEKRWFLGPFPAVCGSGLLYPWTLPALYPHSKDHHLSSSHASLLICCDHNAVMVFWLLRYHDSWYYLVMNRVGEVKGLSALVLQKRPQCWQVSIIDRRCWSSNAALDRSPWCVCVIFLFLLYNPTVKGRSSCLVRVGALEPPWMRHKCSSQTSP